MNKGSYQQLAVFLSSGFGEGSADELEKPPWQRALALLGT